MTNEEIIENLRDLEYAGRLLNTKYVETIRAAINVLEGMEDKNGEQQT